MLFVSFSVTVWTVEAQTWCACEGSNYPQDWDFSTFEEAQDFYNKFWAAEPTDHHFGWCGERHTLLLGVKGSGGDLQSFVGGSDSVRPQVVSEKDWTSAPPCLCRDCLEQEYLEQQYLEQQGLEAEVDPSEHFEELLPASFKE